MATQVPMQGWGQSTPAMQTIFRAGLGVRGAASRRRSRRSSTPTAKKRKSRAATSGKRSKPSRLVKGSAAAKAYMAKIRKLRK